MRISKIGNNIRQNNSSSIKYKPFLKSLNSLSNHILFKALNLINKMIRIEFEIVFIKIFILKLLDKQEQLFHKSPDLDWPHESH